MANDVAATKAKVKGYLDRLVDDYEVTEDEKFTFERGSTRTFVEVVPHGKDNTVVQVWAFVAVAVRSTPALYEYLIRRKYTFGHLVIADDEDGAVITFNHSLLGEHLDWDEFNWAASTVTLVADELDDEVVETFGGRRYQDDRSDPPGQSSQSAPALERAADAFDTSPDAGADHLAPEHENPVSSAAPAAAPDHVSSGGSKVIPASELDQLAVVGRAIYLDGRRLGAEYVNVSGFYMPGFLAAGAPEPGSEAYDTFVDRFLSELVDSAYVTGGWALAGALHVAVDFLADHMSYPSFVELADAALTFMATANVSDSFIPTFLLPRWNALR